MKTSTFIFRVDASEAIGLGHLSRCLFFASYIEAKGHNIVFLTKENLSKNIIELKGFKCQRFSKSIPNLKKLFNSFSVIADINSNKVFEKKSDYNAHLDILRENANSLITFEDMIDYPYCSDVVIIPYCGAQKIMLDSECNSRYLIGEDYFLLKPEFTTKSYAVSKRPKTILITMGGSDPEKITLKVLNAISNLNQIDEIIVVIGKASNISSSDIMKTIHNSKIKINVLNNLENISNVMLECDIAITNSGLTKYELASLGVPSIIISNNKQQAFYSDFFSSFKASIHLGYYNDINEKFIRDKCLELMQKYELRVTMSNSGKKLIDGNGINRIWKAIKEKNL